MICGAIVEMIRPLSIRDVRFSAASNATRRLVGAGEPPRPHLAPVDSVPVTLIALRNKDDALIPRD